MKLNNQTIKTMKDKLSKKTIEAELNSEKRSFTFKVNKNKNDYKIQLQVLSVIKRLKKTEKIPLNCKLIKSYLAQTENDFIENTITLKIDVFF